MIRQRLIFTFVASSLATMSSAADFSKQNTSPPVENARLANWTGLFGGIHMGALITDRQRIVTYGNDPFTIMNVQLGRRTALNRTHRDSIAAFGGGLGYDRQLTPGEGIVVGVAAGWDYIGISRKFLDLGEPVLPGTPRVPSVYRQDLDWLGTATGRLGYAFSDVYLYGSAGLVVGEVKDAATFYNPLFGNALAYRGRRSSIEAGAAYGGGFEFKLPVSGLDPGSMITLKAEALHYILGKRNLQIGGGFLEPSRGSYGARFESEGTFVKVGLNYRFNGS